MYLKKKSVAPLQYSNACNITEICVAMHIMVVVKHMFSTVHNAALSCDKSKALYKHMAVQALTSVPHHWCMFSTLTPALHCVALCPTLELLYIISVLI